MGSFDVPISQPWMPVLCEQADRGALQQAETSSVQQRASAAEAASLEAARRRLDDQRRRLSAREVQPVHACSLPGHRAGPASGCPNAVPWATVQEPVTHIYGVRIGMQCTGCALHNVSAG